MIAQALLEQIASEGVHSVRVVFTDQNGLLRGKTIAGTSMAAALERGVTIPQSLLDVDAGPTGRGSDAADRIYRGRDIVMRPDPTTARLLPWLDRTALVLSDLVTDEGEPIEHSARHICRQALRRLHVHELAFTGGLELEFHLFEVGDNGELSHSHPGWALLGEDPLDRLEPAIEPLRQGLTELGIPPATVEAQRGPSQIELTFAPAVGINVADEAVLARMAIRHIARRNGYRASFMSRPKVGDKTYPSGWHLHQSLIPVDDPDDSSLFMPYDDTTLLSMLGEHYVGGILANAAASCLLTTPTVTGYKRDQPHSPPPDRIAWSHETRGAMLRVIGGPGDAATRVENRAGDSAANPYLYIASQIISGLDGVENDLNPPAPAQSAHDLDGAPLLPATLGEAIDAFSASEVYRQAIGKEAVEYFTAHKRAEWNRFNSAVTDWEQQEYFENY